MCSSATVVTAFQTKWYHKQENHNILFYMEWYEHSLYADIVKEVSLGMSYPHQRNKSARGDVQLQQPLW
jgi:hypothetical protein